MRQGTIAFALAILLPAPAFAQGNAIHWRHDYNQARKEASDKGLPLVIDFGTQACIWCKRLDASTFRDAAVIGLVNERFVALKIDGEKEAALVEALQIQSYPTLVFAAADGRILGRQEGYLDAGRMRDTLQRVLASATKQEKVVLEFQAAADALTLQQRQSQAREHWSQAREDYRAKQYLSCLERCDVLVAGYVDLPEGSQAQRLAAEIRSNTEWLTKTCETMEDRLATLYLALAESWWQKGQPQQAIGYFERVIRTFPDSRHAETARTRLGQIRRKDQDR